ncbi:MAG: hypothetical protein SF097_19830 [Acidobacteriota bacterium]|nr:hypothetical protein [Acidobacteriota bacterium]
MKSRKPIAVTFSLLAILSATLIPTNWKAESAVRQQPDRQIEGDGRLHLIASAPLSAENGTQPRQEQTALTEEQQLRLQRLSEANTPALRAERRAAFYRSFASSSNTFTQSDNQVNSRNPVSGSRGTISRPTDARGVVEQEQPMPGCRVNPASPSIGADVPETYFGPAPSTVQKELIGPLQLLTAGQLDRRAGTIQLPLYRGELRNGKSVWYVLTDSTDQANAAALGLNFSAKLAYSDTGRAVRNARLERGGLLIFEEGEVDFKPERRVTPRPAPDAFPPLTAEPGSIGDRLYSPLVRITNAGGHIYNAPVIAFDVAPDKINFPTGNPNYSLLHDSVVNIDTTRNVVTLRLVPGFSFARPVLYLSTDASDPVVAALEGNTFAPGLQDIEVGNDDSAFSAVERLFLTINGATGCGNPQRQGMNSALIDGRAPLNVLGGIPTVATDYSPLWDVNAGVWTADAIMKNFRSRVSEEFQILALAEDGFITGPGGSPYGSIGVVVNCPIVFRFL